MIKQHHSLHVAEPLITRRRTRRRPAIPARGIRLGLVGSLLPRNVLPRTREGTTSAMSAVFLAYTLRGPFAM